MIQVLSLGAGVQSSTVLRMSIAGELPRLDFAIFADTGWEPPHVYDHLKILTAEAEDAGIPLIVVEGGNIYKDALVSGATRSLMPVFTNNPNGEVGMTWRKCTSEYKIIPVEREIKRLLREHLGLKPRSRLPTSPVVEHWFGISLDEIQRAKYLNEANQPDKWRRITYPLIDRMMTRESCFTWSDDHGFPEPPKSACIGCPFHSNEAWKEIRSRPEEWAEAIRVDEAYRHHEAFANPAFFHRSMVPLAEADLRSMDEKTGQIPLFGAFTEECEGMCGV